MVYKKKMQQGESRPGWKLLPDIHTPSSSEMLPILSQKYNLHFVFFYEGPKITYSYRHWFKIGMILSRFLYARTTKSFTSSQKRSKSIYFIPGILYYTPLRRYRKSSPYIHFPSYCIFCGQLLTGWRPGKDPGPQSKYPFNLLRQPGGYSFIVPFILYYTYYSRNEY